MPAHTSALLLESIIQHNGACLLKETHIARQAGWKPISAYALTQPRHNAMTAHDDPTRILLQSLHDHQLIELTYRDSKGDTSTREVAILSVGHQYFTGYCYLRNEIRTFKTDRVTKATVTNDEIGETHLCL